MAIIIFRYASDDTSIYSNNYNNSTRARRRLFLPKHVDMMRRVDRAVRALRVTHNGSEYGFLDLCARSADDKCVVDGDFLLMESFINALEHGLVTFPEMQTSFGQVDLTWVMAGVDAPHNHLESASIIKLRYYLRVDRRDPAVKWNNMFLKLMENTSLGDGVEIAYSSSESLEQELERGTVGDIVYFGLTMVLMVVYSVLVTTGGNAVSTRAMLACGGVLAAGLGIAGAFGVLCLVGVKYVNFVGIMPFLVIGIGVDDMFLLMSAWGETIHLQDLSVPDRVGITFSKAGIGITITSLTDFLAFLIGITSDFIVVRQFCIYTGVAVILCYVCNATLFGACLALHGQRVYSNRHCLTFRPALSREQLRLQGVSEMKVFCCGGSIPAKNWEDESACEKLPRRVLPRIILNPVVKVILGVVFLVYLGFSIWGAVFLEQGMLYRNLVLDSSYYHRFSTWDTEYFGQRLALAFVVDGPIDYAGSQGDAFLKLLKFAQQDPDVNSTFIRCWLDQYRNTPYYNATSNKTFLSNLFNKYLRKNMIMQTDVVFDWTGEQISASRCYLLTTNLVDPFRQAQLMARLRVLADSTRDLPVFVFQPLFVMLEHTLAILPSTLQTLGTAVLVMFLVTFAFLPQPLMVVLVTMNIILILIGVFGSMYFLGITYSGISMIHLIMSVGFSVDFSAHICAAYLMSDARTRAERAEYAIVHASGPIFNGGMSSLVGVSMLLMSESYIFTTFFKIMSMVITAGAVHAVFFMPILLSYIGPENTTEHDTVPDGHTHSVLKKTETVVSNGIYSGSKLVGKENTKDRNSHKTVLELMKEDDSATEQGAQVKCSVSYSKRKDHIPSENLPAGVESLDVPGNTDGAFLSLFDNLHTDEVDKSDQQPNSITPIESVGTNLSTGRQAFVRQVQEQEAATKPINKLANGST
ncbi:patched domain-containing protein 3-like [Pomacea canaliculata]|nr:patched domain-containing protein 3-like [Pomacea canaliculata]XP_025111121.1 patched domain-containing protein 3-like [Pomacea canaliculata]